MRVKGLLVVGVGVSARCCCCISGGPPNRARARWTAGQSRRWIRAASAVMAPIVSSSVGEGEGEGAGGGGA